MNPIATQKNIDGTLIELARPVEGGPEWIGQAEPWMQLLAAWSRFSDEDVPLNPRLLGKPGVGKTTLATAAARHLGLPVFILQATMDTRPDDLLVTPVLGPDGAIRYLASGLTTAMIVGGAVVLDEGNRMSEKSWASLAPLLDHRRYVESAVAGVRISAHDDFRFVTTMNQDASTYEIPDYIHSRLMPQIHVDFPEEDEERRILEAQVPFAQEEVLAYTLGFLRQAHDVDLRYSVRDGINIVRYAMKVLALDDQKTAQEAFESARDLTIDPRDLEAFEIR